jgi:hypothetical protein
MDFVTICSRQIDKGPNRGSFEIFPDFRVGRSKDLMVRGRSFYAIWDEEAGLWSTDEYDVQRLVDAELTAEADRMEQANGDRPKVKYLGSFGSNVWTQFRKFIQNVSDNSHPLDETLTFADTEVKKSDYVSKRLPYPLTPGDYSAWDELVGTLYNTEERAKLEWSIGAVVSGDARKIQKFLVLYGAAGTGKSTILNIVQKLFDGYATTFDAKALGSSSSAFSTEVFRANPLVAIQHDGDLSKIEDNTKLNSIIAHESMPMNEKYKPGYTARVNAFLFMGTNQPVKISDAKSGIIRRLIDVHPTGVTLPANHYHTLLSKIDFELGAIAYHCLEVYRQMGKNYYNAYRPLEMMFQTDIFFNFIEAHFDVFKEQNSATLKQAYQLYKEWCADTGIDRILPQYKVREELRNYFDEFQERGELNGHVVRSFYVGFNANKFKTPVKDDITYSLVMEETTSILDEMLKDMPAQLAKEDEFGQLIPDKSWRLVKTKLSDVDTSQLHFVKVPENHIVIDFDLKDENGDKSLERNLVAASNWPATYGELSRGGSGVHLHYIYDGDVNELSTIYSDGIEVKTLLGDASLRRRLSKCNNVPVAKLSGGLPVKEKKMLADNTIKSERGLRELIARNLRKEIHPGTKPSIDFIHKILEDAHKSDLKYDVTDLRPRIIAFANNSSNQPLQALKVVQRMAWKSDHVGDDPVHPDDATIFAESLEKPEKRLAFFDVEVYPNLFVCCWKYEGPDATVVKMINPPAHEVEELFKLNLVGFYNRRYDNHILYAAFMGYNNQALFELSEKIIANNRSGTFGEAYGLSYADIWDFSSKKQSLKRFQIELGLPHIELDIPWNQPVPEEMIPKIVDYCANDVMTTEATFESRKQDFVARQILADLSGLTVNDPTAKHTAKIIFGNDKRPQEQFVYTNLSKEFPGYEFDLGKSSYRGEDPSEGGYVYAEPGIYENVAVLDIASMHPSTIIALNLFGDYTPNFGQLLDARLAIKRKDYDSARRSLGGKLAPHLGNIADAEALSYALKIVINTVYGLTSAKFDNPFRDIRNIDNIVAKRGALFMIDLKNEVQARGFQVVHIKTDSIKIPNATPQIIDFVFEFGKKFGYDFEHETTYDKFCLVNDAVYIARKNAGGEHFKDKWDAVGAQFQHPYVFKQLFSKEPIEFNDLCETKQVTQGAMYLDFEHERPAFLVEGLTFVGKTGRFVPVREGFNGGVLWRVKDGKNYAVSGTKGYLWVEADVAKSLPEGAINMDYFEGLVDDAIKTIEKFGSFEEFIE